MENPWEDTTAVILMEIRMDNLQANNLQQITMDAGSDPNKYFNNYFDQIIDISPEQHDAVVGFFETVTDNKESALALASAVIYTSNKQGADIMQVLDQFSKFSRTELNGYLCMFLNLNRVGTSLLGVSNPAIKNQYVERSIRP